MYVNAHKIIPNRARKMNVTGFAASSTHRPSPMSVFKLSTFCIVTGASRGLGREIALQLVQGWTMDGEYVS